MSEVLQDNTADEEWLKQWRVGARAPCSNSSFNRSCSTKALTPNAALLKFQGSANLTVEQVLKRRSEFLTTHGLNVISVRAEPGVVAIAIARPNRRVLHLPEVWKQWNPDCTHGNHDLLIAVKEEDSSPLVSVAEGERAAHADRRFDRQRQIGADAKHHSWASPARTRRTRPRLSSSTQNLASTTSRLRACHICKAASLTTKTSHSHA